MSRRFALHFAGHADCPWRGMKTFPVLAFLSACGALAVGCNTLCTEVACTDGVTTSLTVDVAALEGADVRVCRESDCVDGSIFFEGPVATCDVAESADFFTGCQVSADGVVSFSIQLRTDDVEDEEAYSFTISSPANAELASVEGVVTYTASEINGSGCGYCYGGSL
jgi:hypothetical protein